MKSEPRPRMCLLKTLDDYQVIDCEVTLEYVEPVVSGKRTRTAGFGIFEVGVPVETGRAPAYPHMMTVEALA